MLFEDELIARFGSMQLLAPILPTGNPVEVVISLHRDGEDLIWSSEKGQGISLTGGAYSQLLVVVRERRPYELLLR